MDEFVALVVEDEALIALETEDLLTTEGFTTIVAASRAQATRLGSHDFAVAIVNIKLAGEIAGQLVIQMLREQKPDLPVVVVTGFAASAPEADLRGLGWPTIRLRKPAGRAALAAAVHEVIAQARDGVRPTDGRRMTDRRGAGGS